MKYKALKEQLKNCTGNEDVQVEITKRGLIEDENLEFHGKLWVGGILKEVEVIENEVIILTCR